MLFHLFGGGDFLPYLLDMIYRIPGILIAIAFHECAHAYSAYKLGDPTARNLGRMTLDPLKHLDLIGGIMLLLVGYGWAKPVPVNPRNFKKLRRDDTIVSLAGCAVNFVLAFLLTGIFYLVANGFKVQNEIVLRLIESAVMVNIGLGIFNLIPIPPLDGYHVLKNIFIRLGPRFWGQYERFGPFILIAVVFSGVLDDVLSFLFIGILNLFSGFYQLFL